MSRRRRPLSDEAQSTGAHRLAASTDLTIKAITASPAHHRLAQACGFSLHAGIAIGGAELEKLERRVAFCRPISISMHRNLIPRCGWSKDRTSMAGHDSCFGELRGAGNWAVCSGSIAGDKHALPN